MIKSGFSIYDLGRPRNFTDVTPWRWGHIRSDCTPSPYWSLSVESCCLGVEVQLQSTCHL